MRSGAAPDAVRHGTATTLDGGLDRRALLRGAVLGGFGTGALTLGLGARAAPAQAAATGILADVGVGMYTDGSTAFQMSGFSITPIAVTCAVGLPAHPDLGGPFSMLMYATRIDGYAIDRAAGRLDAKGRMRSVTSMIGGLVMEDVEHDFIATAVDGRDAGRDRFDVHFVTPMWTPGSNPMATPSADHPGLSRFGGDVVVGSVEVGATAPPAPPATARRRCRKRARRRRNR